MTVGWLELLDQWSLMVADFSTEYGIRLTVEYPSMLWHEFVMLVTGLMSSDSRIARHFAPEHTEN